MFVNVYLPIITHRCKTFHSVLVVLNICQTLCLMFINDFTNCYQELIEQFVVDTVIRQFQNSSTYTLIQLFFIYYINNIHSKCHSLTLVSRTTRPTKLKFDMVVLHMLKGALRMGFGKFLIEFVLVVIFLVVISVKLAILNSCTVKSHSKIHHVPLYRPQTILRENIKYIVSSIMKS